MHGRLDQIRQQRQTQQAECDQQQHLAEIGEDNGVDDIGLFADKLRAAGDIVHGERREHDRRRPATGDAQRQQCGHGAGLRGAVGRLRGHHALRVAAPEGSGLGGFVARLYPGQQIGDRRADPRYGADQYADQAAAQDHPPVAQGVAGALAYAAHRDPARGALGHQVASARAGDQFRGGEHAHHGRNRGDAVEQIIAAQRAACHARLAVAQGAEPKPGEAGDQPFQKPFAAEAGDQRNAPEDGDRHLRRPHQQHQL